MHWYCIMFFFLEFYDVFCVFNSLLSRMESCSRDLEGSEEDSMKILREGISLAINFWWLIRLKITDRSLFDSEPPELWVDSLFSCFIQSKHLPCANIKLKLEQCLKLFLENESPDDNSIPKVRALIFIDSIIIFYFFFSTVRVCNQSLLLFCRFVIN